MNNKNIDIEYSSLEELIIKLEKDKNDVETSLKNICNILTELDNSKWNSPEKEKIDDGFIKYINKASIDIPNQLNNTNIVLKQALNKYQTENEKLETEVENLI